MGNVGLGTRIVATHCDSRVCQVNSGMTCRRKSQILSSIHGRVCLKILFQDDVATWVMHGK